MIPLLRIIYLVIIRINEPIMTGIHDNEPIITVIIHNNGIIITVIIRNYDVIMTEIIRKNEWYKTS